MTHRSRNIRTLLPALAALVLASVFSGPASAAGASKSAATDDRLFDSFAEDAVIVPNQWWEGSLSFANYDNRNVDIDVTALMLTAALKPLDRLEVGGRVGFASASASGSDPDGSGATDLDLWGKWHLGAAGGRADFVLGGLATVPTGDNTAGLGYDAFNFEGFGAMRYRLPEAIFTVHFGLRMNGDGEIQGHSLDGKTSALLGVGAIYPLSSQVGLVGEINMESERWKNADSNSSILAGVNWRPWNRGILRAAVALGLSDAMPDARLIVGYAYSF